MTSLVREAAAPSALRPPTKPDPTLLAAYATLKLGKAPPKVPGATPTAALSAVSPPPVPRTTAPHPASPDGGANSQRPSRGSTGGRSDSSNGRQGGAASTAERSVAFASDQPSRGVSRSHDPIDAVTLSVARSSSVQSGKASGPSREPAPKRSQDVPSTSSSFGDHSLGLAMGLSDADVIEMRARVVQLESRLRATQSIVTSLRRELAAHQQRNSDVSAELTVAVEDRDRLEEQVALLLSQKEDAAVAETEHTDTIVALSAERDDAVERSRRYEQEISALEQARREQHLQTQEWKRRCEAMSAAMSECEAKRQAMADERSEWTAALDAMGNRVDTLETAAIDRETIIEELVKALHDKETTLQSLLATRKTRHDGPTISTSVAGGVSTTRAVTTSGGLHDAAAPAQRQQRLNPFSVIAVRPAEAGGAERWRDLLTDDVEASRTTTGSRRGRDLGNNRLLSI